MFKLSYSNFKSNLKKYVAIMTAVMIAMMFIIASESIFSSYGEVKVRNAYRYNGVWDYRLKTSSDEDIKVDGVTYSGYAENQNIGVLDIIPELEHIGDYIDCTDRYLLAITGIDSDLYDTIPYKLIKGNYPVSADELLVANNTVYKGKVLKTGDVIELDIKERHDEDGNILGDEGLSVSDVYTDIATRKYTICGIYDGASFTMGTFIHSAYSGKSGTGNRIYYYTCNSHYKEKYEEVWEKLNSIGNVEANQYVKMTVESVYKSDYFKASKAGVFLFQGIIIIVSLATIILNLFQIGESERKNIRQMYTIGAGKGKITGIYNRVFAVCEFTGVLAGTGLAVIALTAGKKVIISILNSEYTDFSLIKINPVKIVMMYIIVLIVTMIFMLIKCNGILTIHKRKITGEIKKKPCNSVSKLASTTVRNRWIFNIVLTSSLTIMLLMITILLSIHPGIKSRSEEEAGIYMSQGHYFIYTDKDIDEYEEEFKSIDGVKQFRLECGARIAINGRDNCDSGIVGCNRDFYNFLREKNPWMVDFDTFEENGMVYAVNEGLKDGKRVPTNDAKKGDTFRYSYSRAEDSDKENEIKIDGIISMPVDWLSDSREDRLTFFVSRNKMEDEAKEVGCIPERDYTIICEKGKIKSAGEKLQDLAYRLGVGLMDTAETYELAEDNHEIQVFVVAVVSGLFILIGLGGMITSIRLDNMSRKREFSIYRTLGMDSHIKTELQIYEYISVWLSALILSTILVIILINTLLKGMVSYYYVENKTLFINLVKVAAGTLAILALIVIAGQLGKGKRHDKVK
ncbi:ABC transporter permease [Eshraghiella crossota]|nr:ABC transporter permease [Butyrivibrio crossotus]UWO50524.1 ABC transporter permease [Butyrivibrio crossotus]